MAHDPAADQIVAQAEASVRAWRAAHPTATFAEIEAVLDQQLRAARATLLAAVLPPHQPSDDPPACAQCGGVLVWRGEQERTLRTDGDRVVPLRRAYDHCPHCGSGLFPPGPDA